MKKFLIFTLITIMVLTIASCGKAENIASNSNDVTVSSSTSSDTKDDSAKTSLETKELSLAEKTLEGMTLEEKVWQMFFISPEDILENISAVIQAGETTKAAIETYPVGGIIYFGKNIETRQQVIDMIKNTQSFSKIPLFISVDEEGGRVARLGDKNVGVTQHPPMAEIGATGDPDKAFAIGETLGTELTELGFNMDFAPVADVITVENNEDIGNRSFGTDPAVVADMVSSQVKGMQGKGLSATLKHFPSNGSTVTNTHYETGVCTRTLEEMRQTEFIPFKAGIDAGADVIMIAHMTAIDIDDVPATLSEKVIKDILRNELGFEGIVISDALNMGAITSVYTPEEAAVAAVNAGVDMLLMSPNVKSAANTIIEKVKSGEISEERINESVTRILSLKEKRNVLK